LNCSASPANLAHSFFPNSLAAEKGVLVDFAGKELADVTIAPEEEVASSDDTEGDEYDPAMQHMNP